MRPYNGVVSKYAFALRPAVADDAITIAALSTQVFLDTYAAQGVFPHLAAEAFTEYSVEAFTGRLNDRARKFVLAEIGGGLVGFAEVLITPEKAPAGDVSGAELVRLYVQPQTQGSGLGKALIGAAERLASTNLLKAMWLTAWEKNRRALAFYARLGYADVGPGTYTFRGRTYGTRVLVKRW